MAKMKLELTEKEIAEAIIEWSLRQMDNPPNFKNVHFNVEQRRDQMDRLDYGHTVTATVSE